MMLINYFSGHQLNLILKIKSLFQHLYETMRCTPTYFSDYSAIIRLLIPVSDYRIRVGKRIYRGNVLFFGPEPVLSPAHEY